MILFCQLDYPEELGTGNGYSIAHFGCAEVSIAMLLANVFHLHTDPHQLNSDLIRVQGYADNGAGAVDLMKWGSLTSIYDHITLLFNNPYYNKPAGDSLPADLSLLDAQLSKGYSVIVGVSFNHNPKEPVPTHYVEIYRKNSDGTYQCRDPWFRDGDRNFDHNYALNGMDVAQCILQMISYIGPLPQEVSLPPLPLDVSTPPALSPTPLSVEQTATLESAIAQGSATGILTPPPPPVPAPPEVLSPPPSPDTVAMTTVPTVIYQAMKTNTDIYAAMSAAGYPNIEAIDKMKESMVLQMQHLTKESEEKLRLADDKKDEDFQTIQDLKEEVLSATHDAEVASQAAMDFYGKKSRTLQDSIILGEKVHKLESDIKTLVDASGIPTPSTKSVAGIVKYFANLRFAAEKVFQPVEKIKSPAKEDTGTFLLHSFGLRVILASLVIGVPLAFFFIRHVFAMIK